MVPAALTTAVMMPVIAKILQHGVPQQYLMALGMVMFSVFMFWCYFIMTPDTSADNFFWPLIFRGVALGLLFIPVTALSLSKLKGQQIGQGAAFTGMMRQLGGSFGIAMITTFMSRQNMVHRSDLVGKLNTNDPALLQKIQGLQHGFMAKGMSADVAVKSSYTALDRMVFKQSAILSYMDVFFYLGIAFLICVPFVMMVRGNIKKKVDLSEAMH